jgi:hypothetical protein
MPLLRLYTTPNADRRPGTPVSNDAVLCMARPKKRGFRLPNFGMGTRDERDHSTVQV